MCRLWQHKRQEDKPEQGSKSSERSTKHQTRAQRHQETDRLSPPSLPLCSKNFPTRDTLKANTTSTRVEEGDFADVEEDEDIPSAVRPSEAGVERIKAKDAFEVTECKEMEERQN